MIFFFIILFIYLNKFKLFNKNISKNIRYNSTKNKNIIKSTTLNPWWVTGFTYENKNNIQYIVRYRLELEVIIAHF